MKKFSQGGYTGNTENAGIVHDGGYFLAKETADRLKPAGVVSCGVSVKLDSDVTPERIRNVMRNINGLV